MTLESSANFLSSFQSLALPASDAFAILESLVELSAHFRLFRAVILSLTPLFHTLA